MSASAFSLDWQDGLDTGLRLVLDGSCRVVVIPCPGLAGVTVSAFKNRNPGVCPFVNERRDDLDWRFFPASVYGPVLVIFAAGAMTEREVSDMVGRMYVN